MTDAPGPSQPQLTREELEAELAALGRYRERRDTLVKAAYAAGVNPHRIHVLTRLGRTTVYRILGIVQR